MGTYTPLKKKMHSISVPHGASAEISRELGVSRFSVYLALAGKVNSIKAHKIRTLALSKYYGQENI